MSAPSAPSIPPVQGAVWQRALAAWVQSRKRYPDEARRQAVEGQVGIRFAVGSDGRIVSANIVRSSGSDLLDEAALAMFQGASAPPPPADLAQAPVAITVVVRYRLEE